MCYLGIRKGRLIQYKQNRLIELFVAGSTARTPTYLVNANTKTAISHSHCLRVLIYKHATTTENLEDEVEVDESYFGGRRKGKCGRGASGKVPIFGL